MQRDILYMIKKSMTVFILLLVSSCNFTISKTVKPITINELKKFAAEHNIKGLVTRVENSKGTHKLEINSFPTVLVVNDKLEIVYKHIGYSSLFKKDLKEAIDCNTIFCFLNSKYSKNKSKYSGMYINDLALKDLNGNHYRLSSIVKKDSVAVIDFWATWCKPCHLANKDIAELHEEYKDTDVTFIAVNVDKIKK